MELTIEKQIRAVSGLAAGASFFSKTGNLWVKGEGTKWIHRTGNVTRIFSTKEVMEREGLKTLRTFGDHRMHMVEAPKHRGKIDDDLMQEQERLLESLSEGNTIIGKKNMLWVSVGDGHWVNTRASGAFMMKKNRSVIESHGPFAVHNQDEPLEQESIDLHMSRSL